MAIPGEPKLEVPTIYKAYFSGLNFRGYTPTIPEFWPKIWYIYVPPGIPIDINSPQGGAPQTLCLLVYNPI